MPARAYQSQTVTLGNRGFVLKADASLLAEGQFRRLKNFVSLQEGSIVTRNGYKRLNASPFEGENGWLSLIHSIARLATGTDEATNYVYLGEGQDIYRITAANLLSGSQAIGWPIASLGTDAFGKTWRMEAYRKATSGDPYGYFATVSLMLKDSVSDNFVGAPGPLQKWGIDRGPVPVKYLGSIAGLLNSNEGAAQLYSWVMTYRNPHTGQHSNPTMEMVQGHEVINGAAVLELHAVSPAQQYHGDYGEVALDSWCDPQLLGEKSIAVWRKGGSFTDSYYRLVGYADFPQNQTITEVDIVAAVATAATPVFDPAWPSGLLIKVEGAGRYHLDTVNNPTTLVINLGGLPLPDGHYQITIRWWSGEVTAQPNRLVWESGAEPIEDWEDQPVIMWLTGGTRRSWVTAIYTGLNAAASPELHFPGTTTITRSDGKRFDTTWTAGTPVKVNGVWYALTVVLSETQLVINAVIPLGAGLPWTVGVLDVSPGTGVALSETDVDFEIVTLVEDDLSFIDNAPDADISANAICEFDNDPPVTASLDKAFIASVASYALGAGAAGSKVTMNVTLPDQLTDLRTVLRPGSILTLGEQYINPETGETEDGSFEQVVAWALPAADQITCWIQRAHDLGEAIRCASVANAPCPFPALAYNAIFLAGESNNPETLHKSKPGRVEAWPIVNLTDGAPGSIEVGSPSNPIHGLAEWNGVVACLNKTSIFEVWVTNGYMNQPQRTPAQRGLFAPNGWCRADDQIAYVAYDGVYAWAGGESAKLSEGIDPIFKGEWVNSIPPVSFNPVPGGAAISDLEIIQLSYRKGELFMVYRDASGNYRRLRGYPLYQRLSLEETAQSPFRLYFAEDIAQPLFATHEQLSGQTVGRINLDDTPITNSIPATTDGWTAAGQDNGTAIPFEALTGFYHQGAPAFAKQYGDVVLDLDNEADAVTVNVYYDYSDTIAETFTIAASASPNRYGYVMALNSARAKEAKAIGFRFSGNATRPVTLHSLTFHWLPLEEPQRGRALDWDDLGHRADKRLFELYLEFDTNAQDVTLYLDTQTGLLGSTTINLAVQTWTLNSAAHNDATGPGRARITLPINDNTVVKMVRLRPAAAAQNFKLWDYSFAPFESYPPDVVPFTEYNNGGNPYEKYFQQMILDVDTNGQPIPVTIEGDGGDKQTVTVTSTWQTRDVVLTLNPVIKARKARLRTGTVPVGGKFQLFGHDFVTLPADKGPVSHSYDWDDLEWPFDKHLKRITLEYDNTGAAAVTMNMDTLTGIEGGTINTAAFQFTLDQTGVRAKQQFVIPDYTTDPRMIAKMIRVYPVADTVGFKVWKYWVDKVDYPADKIAATEYKDFNNPYEKYFQQIILDVDTNGQTVPITLYGDGAAKQTLNVSSTWNTRDVVLTLNPQIKARKIRFKVGAIPAGGKFQLWNDDYIWLPADRGPVTHSFDWDDLQWPFDKHLKRITLEYDTDNAPTVMLMDTLTGLGGGTQNIAAFSFTLDQVGRAKQQFVIGDGSQVGSVVKMIRIYPQADNTIFKHWKYYVDKVDYPPDNLAATEPDSMGYECDKIVRDLIIDVDTGDVDAKLKVDCDGKIVETFTVRTSFSDRSRTLNFHKEIVGMRFRIFPVSGSGGKFQLFSHRFRWVSDACASVFWDSYEQAFGFNGWRLGKQFWVEYRCCSSVICRVYVDNKRLLYETTLPPHEHRDVERFYLPASRTDPSGDVVLNKSKTDRMILESCEPCCPVYLYLDGTRLEWIPLNGDQRASYQQMPWFQPMPVPAGTSEAA